MKLNFFNFLVVLLGVSVGTAALFHRIKLPPILGYLLIGVVVGPFVLVLTPDMTLIREIAEFGVVFLLFTIGLEFSWARFLTLKRDVFLLGGLEVLLMILGTLFIGYALGMSQIESFLIGGVVAMSSTAIVMKQLSDQIELITPFGIRSLAILIFQDLMVIPLLILIPAFAGAQSSELILSIAQAFLKAMVVILAILLFGRFVFRPMFYLVARTRSVELFTLTTLFVTLGTAWMTQQFGRSLALGAFLSGILLGETEFRPQIEADIRPFRDVLLGLFFISIGMQIDLKLLFEFWPSLLLLLGALILFKFILIAGITRWSGVRWPDAVRTGLILAQGGEFGFAILTLAQHYNVVRHEVAEVILGAIFLSMIIAPFLIRHHYTLVCRLFSFAESKRHTDTLSNISEIAEPLKNHIIICGYGRLGQHMAKLLVKFNVPYVALDLDAPRIEKARAKGEAVCYGDASQRDVLLISGLMQAEAVVVTVNDPATAHQVLETIRQHHEKIPVLIRVVQEEEADVCYAKGATIVIPELLEAGLSMGMQLLLMLNKPLHEVNRVLNKIRRDRYELLKVVIPGEETWDKDEV